MKKNSILLFLCLAISFTSFAGHKLDGPFDEISVNGKIDLILESGEEEAIEIFNDEEKINFEVRQGALVIKRKERWKYSSYKRAIKVVVTYKTLRKISAEAGAEVRSGQVLQTADALRLSFGSGASAELEIDVKDLEASAGEGAVLELEGYAEESNLQASTGGVIEAFDLNTDRVYVKANIGGTAEVSVGTRLEARAHTGGVIEYRGDPEKVSISSELGGRVRSVGV